ncbi:MAG TPA: SprT-like domain-containing protein [Ruminiclostridium sp.]|nr:SprT-like domain-containing protein [Ruminiclostridium sp.]
MFDNLMMKMASEAINYKRGEISKQLMLESSNIKNGTISTISTDDLELLFQLYDRLFFENWFKESYKGKMKFSLSRRMVKSAGLTICPKSIDKIAPDKLVLEIRIGVDFFYHYGHIEGRKTVCGIKTTNSLEALQLVFEHELCHVIEFINFKKSNCKGKRFKTIASNLFGHTESYHRLPTQRQIAKQKLGINIGDTVSFNFEGRILTGILYNINKRATVMVRNNGGTMVDNKGNRYSKYYVPLILLKS